MPTPLSTAEQSWLLCQALHGYELPSDAALEQFTGAHREAFQTFISNNGNGLNALKEHLTAPERAELRALVFAVRPGSPRPVEIGAPFELTDVPELPRAARLSEQQIVESESVGRWLEDYAAFSETVAPLAPTGFHKSAGLWLGSLAIARRLCLRLPHSDVYPNLAVLWVADTTLYTKSTALNTVKRFARQAIPHLLAISEFTPEALLDEFAGRMPSDIDALSPTDREMWSERRNFAAQRGIILDEAASLFASFKRDHNSGLPYYLLRMIDCDPEVEKITRGSGKVVAHNTYLSFIGATTPNAIMRTDTEFLWGSGLWPRFVLSTPDGLMPWKSQPEDMNVDPPQDLTTVLQTIDGALDTPVYPTPPKATSVLLADGVHAAYAAYSKATLRDMLTGTAAPPKALWGVYGRLPIQAVKIAIILAAFDWALASASGAVTITPGHWARAQMIAESQRVSAHRLWHTLTTDQNETTEYERRLINYVQVAGQRGASIRDLYRAMHDKRETVERVITGLVKDGVLCECQPNGARVPRFKLN